MNWWVLMPANLARNMHQDLTYWAPGAKDRYGKTTFAAPVVKKCRWEDRIETFQDKQGEESTSKSRVMLVDTDIDVDGYVYLGVSVATDPLKLAGAFEIQAISKTPDLRNIRNLTTLTL